MLRQFQRASLAVWFLGICLPAVHAQDQIEQQVGPNLIVKVRAIKGVDAEGEQGTAQAHRVDPAIKDLTSKLSKFSFHSYRLLSTDERIVPTRKKETLSPVPGNTLVIRPILTEHKKICVWLKWQDKSGMDVLDTRMHLEPGESMVTGTEDTPHSGLIFAIDVTPVGGEVATQVSAKAK